MKLSDAMNQGWLMVKKQCKLRQCEGDPQEPRAVCALGAAGLAMAGDAQAYVPEFREAREAYASAYGAKISRDNDDGMDVPSIVKRLRAIHE
jgi:hypothetical protein